MIPRSLSLTLQLPPAPGCEKSAATVSLKTPLSSRSIFPPPFSSAGVPTSSIPTCRSFALAVAERNAPTIVIEIRLWPQPCPTSGRASYSARSATAGPGGVTRDGLLAHRETHPVRRHPYRDVAEVGRCGDENAAHRRDVEALELGRDDVAQRQIRLHRLVVRAILRDLDLRAGKERGALRDV